jgi:hypothetical protein
LQAYGTCHDASATGRRHLAETDTRAADRLRGLAANTLVVALFGSIFLGVGFLALLRRNAHLCVKASCAAQVIIPAVMAVSLLAAGAIGPALLAAAGSALAAYCFHLWRAELVLCARLLSVAGEALTHNPHLVSASLGLNAVHIAAVLPVLALMVAASRVGDAVPYGLAAATVAGVDGAAQTCVDAAGAAVQCCIWQTSPASTAYIVLAALCTSWTTFLVFEMRLFAIAHVVVRWYSLPLGARLPGSPLREVRSHGMDIAASFDLLCFNLLCLRANANVLFIALLQALSCAAGPAFGSLCLGSAILTLADAARQAAEATRRRGGGLLACLLATLVACISELVASLTRFATIRLAATGQNFMDAAHDQVAVLKRNFLATYAVWSFPPMVLAFTSAVAAGGAALIATAAFAAAGSRVVSSSGPVGSAARGDASDALGMLSALVGGGSFVLVLVVLSYLSSLIIHITDVVYVCWAEDQDKAVCLRPEVHAVFAAVPSVRVGALVQQPDGELGYAPDDAQPPRQQNAVRA